MFKRVTGTITRTADTTAYTSGDVIGTATDQAIQFDAVSTVFVSGKGVILGATVIDSAAPTTLPSLELWLFTAAIAAAADNAAFAVTDAEMLNFVAIYPLASAYVGLATGNHVQLSAVRGFSFELPSGSDALYGYLVVRNAYTPISAEVFKVILSISD